MTWLATLALALLLVAAGRTVVQATSRLTAAPDGGWPLALAAGLLALDLLLLACHWTGVPWSRWTLLAPLGALAFFALVPRRAHPRSWPKPQPGPGDAVAVLALGCLALLTATGWLIFPDLVYHWGIKAGRFAAAGGFDLELLTRPTPHALHPDYPPLLSGLIAATSLVAGVRSGDPWPGMAWGPVLALATWWAGRRWLAEAGVSFRTLQLASAAFGLFLGYHAVAFRRATDAGWFLVLALLLAAPALTRPRQSGDEARIGVAAALAAAAKLEGMPLALFLVAAWLWPRRDPRPGESLRERLRGTRWLPLLAPGVLVTLPWAAVVVHHDLAPGTHWGGLRPERLVPVVRAMVAAAAHSLWAGFGLLTLALLAALWLARRERRLATVLCLQLGVYLVAYLATPLDPNLLVETSFARLLGHLTPAALLAAVEAGDRWATAEARSSAPGGE